MLSKEFHHPRFALVGSTPTQQGLVFNMFGRQHDSNVDLLLNLLLLNE